MTPKPSLRKTKIVATVGPACSTAETLQAMIAAGMNVARLNLSHGTFEGHAEWIPRIREAAARVGREVAIMVDTRGIEIRTRQLQGHSVDLVRDSRFALYVDGRVGNQDGVSISYANLPEEVLVGAPILVDDGAIELVVEAVDPDAIHCKVVHGGTLKENKSVNLPETELAMSDVSPENQRQLRDEIEFAANHDADYLAASFVQKASDVETIRKLLRARNKDIPIIAKIENKAGVANLVEIVQAADGLMVARGDLGVELPLAAVPQAQKRIIRTTVAAGKPVITATQMLASMEQNPKPTRAEAADVANAILDGSSAVMLSGETAAGRFPVQAVQTMDTLALHTEASLHEFGFLQNIARQPSHSLVTDAVTEAAVRMASQLHASAIITLTTSGFTARMVSKHRPDRCPILAITGALPVIRRLSMNWGVIPIRYEGDLSDEAKLEFALEQARSLAYVKSGDHVVVTAGQSERTGATDLIRVVTVA